MLEVGRKSLNTIKIHQPSTDSSIVSRLIGRQPFEALYG